MQGGDLSEWERPRMVIVIEGVLCTRISVPVQRRFRHKTFRYETHWHDTPMKRTVVMKKRFPETALDLVTFVSQDFCDQAAELFDAMNIPYDTIAYREFNMFVRMLKFQNDIKVIYDSDWPRLNQYGQLGTSVQLGEDY